MATKTTTFPVFPPGEGYGTTHLEHGRSWRYVEPGIWKSVGGSGGSGPGGEVTWDDVAGKPAEFPPEAHTHEQADIDGLENRLDAIEDSITDGGSFIDAPSNDKLYGRKNELWEEVVIPEPGASSWNDLTDKPADFPPSDHTHEIADVNGLQDALNDAGGAPAWDDVTNKPTDFPPSSHNHTWEQVTGKPTEFPPETHQHGWDQITGKPSEFPPSSHNHAWDQITGKPTEFPPSAHNHDGVYQPVGDYIEDADSDGKQYARQDGAWSEVVIPEAGAAVQIGATFDGTPKEGDQWLETPAGEEAVMWVYDGDKWLQMPGGGGSGQDGITTATLPLANPTREATGLTTQSDANNYFAEAIAKVVNEDGDVVLNDYYTSTEADAKFQPKGDYIEDAPQNGELYVRKDGAWELYTPSSGGGGFMVPVTPPQTAGDYAFGIKSNGGSGTFSQDCGSWYANKASSTATFTVPAGYKFVLQNFIANGASKDVMFNGIYLDGEQINNSSDTSGKYKKTEISNNHDYDKRNFWPSAQNFVISSTAVFTLKSSADNWFHIFGYFIPADNTRESAELREAYLVEEAERIAAMPAPEPEPEEVGTQEIPDE